MGLTATFVKTAKAGKHSDGNGLFLIVDAKRRGKWVFFYTSPVTRKRREMTLKRSDEIGLAEAREIATDHRKTVRAGKDPIIERDRGFSTDLPTTVEAVSKDAFESRRTSLKGDGHAGRWWSPLKVHVLDKIGNMQISEIDQHVIRNTIGPVWKLKPDASLKALTRLGIVIRHGAALGLDVDVQAVEKARALLGEQGHTVEHIPSMPWADVPEFYASLIAPTSASRALRFLILSAMRSGSVRHARREWITDDMMVVPGEFMKGRRGKTQEFRLPLTLSMLALIDECPSNGLLFPARGGKTLSDMTLTAILRRADSPFRPHGFRSSFRNWCEDTGADWAASETALAHQIRSGVERSYARGDFLDLRRHIMHRWCDHVTGQESADVIPLYR